MPNEKGETRRSYYDRLGEEGVEDRTTGLPLSSPEIEIPKGYEKHWRIYFDVSRAVSRINDGKCSRIPPSEWLAWQQLTGVKVDYEIMNKMDEAYCKQMNIELEEFRERSKPQGN